MSSRLTKLQSQHGYTLVELMLYVSITAMLLLSVTAFFAMMASSRAKSQAVNEVNQQGIQAMDYITQTVRNASTITAPAAAASAAALTVTVPTSTLSPTVFDLTGTTLEVKEGTTAYVPLTGSQVQVSSLTFKNLSKSGSFGIVQISFVVTHTSTSGRNEFSYSKTFTSSVALR